MPKRLLSLVLVILFARLAAAQAPPKDEFEINDIPEEEAHPYFALGGGFNATIIQPNFDDINAKIKTLGISPLDNGMLLTGGSGFISAPFGKNLRIGGFGFNGKSTQCNDVVDTVNNTPISERRTAEFSLSGGGITIEYVIPFAFTNNRVVLTGGLALGAGSIGLQLDQTTSDPRTWNDFFTGGQSANFSRQIHATYYSYEPKINLEYSVLAFLMIRASVGYQGTAVGTFTVDRGIDISGVPAISGNGLEYGGGIFVGIFR